MNLLALLAVVLALPVGWIWLVDPVLRRRRDLARDLARQRAPASALLAEVKQAVRFEHWERFASGERILALDGACAEDDLFAAVMALWGEVCDEDHREGRSGRDSNFFELYDSGIALIREELERRAGS
jgi:hypothetical protein